MPLPHYIALAALAILPLAAGAQRFDPADGSAIVPAIDYISAFKDYRIAVDEETAPDQLWRAVNANLQSKNAASEAETDASQALLKQQVAPTADAHASHHGEGK